MSTIHFHDSVSQKQMWMSVNRTVTTASPVSSVSMEKAPSPASVQMGIAKWAQNALVRNENSCLIL